MSSFRTRKLEELRGHGKPLFGLLGPLEERIHDLRRHLVADGGVGPSAVVVGLDELDHRVLCGVAGREAPAVVHLILQRGEERLGHGVVVAVAGAAAGKAHVVGPRPLGQGPAGVLGASVGMENGVSGHAAARLGRLERRHRDVGGHPAREQPADHHARAQVDHRGQVQPPLAGAKVRDVAHELVGGNGAREVAARQVGAGLGLRVGLVGKLPPALYRPLVDRLGIEAQFPAAFRGRPSRRDHAVGDLAAELVGVPGGWVGHVRLPFVVVALHSNGLVPLACVSERTIQVTPSCQWDRGRFRFGFRCAIGVSVGLVPASLLGYMGVERVSAGEVVLRPRLMAHAVEQ